MPYALVGGATGMVGDPSGKATERAFLSEDTLRHNQAGIGQQLSRFLDFTGPRAAVLVNNYDWFGPMGFLTFLREVGKHLTVSYMMAKDSVRNRLETGLSFTEFSYQLLQAYDFYHLSTHHGVRLQMGGSDQWGNITAGTELIRRKDGGDAFALTTPLVTKADGTKFGKSESGNVWLDPTFTSPFQFYQFWLNVSDADAPRLLRVFTLLTQPDILALESEHAQAPHRRVMQKALAQDVTTRVHSAADYEVAVRASEILFGKGTLEALRSLPEATLLAALEGVPHTDLPRPDWQSAPDVAELLSTLTGLVLFGSKGEVRRAVAGGGVRINQVKLTEATRLTDLELLQGKYLLVSKGKTNHLIRVV